MAQDEFLPVPLEAAVQALHSRLPMRPSVGIVLGSGLGAYADRVKASATIPYREIPGFPHCSVEGHAGRLVLTKRAGVCVAILQGRAHRYEGYTLETVTRPVRVLAGLGVTTLIVTCAAGALDEAQPGTCMLIEDHLNLMGDNPLIGPAPGGGWFGRFVEMAEAYDPVLLALAEQVARTAGIPMTRGVLAAVAGPTYETRAEAAMLGRLGAQAVSMSTVPEVIAARALGLRVLGLALITNRSGAPLDRQIGHRQVLAMAASRAETVGVWLDGVLDGLSA